MPICGVRIELECASRGGHGESIRSRWAGTEVETAHPLFEQTLGTLDPLRVGESRQCLGAPSEETAHPLETALGTLAPLEISDSARLL